MSCYGCSLPFGFLNRERGCPKCGFSYCKKCLRYKIEGNNTLICKRCYELTTATTSTSSGPGNKQQRLSYHDDNDIPLNFRETVQVVKAIRRLESLENPSKPPIVVYTESSESKRKPRIDMLKKGMSIEDQKLVDRLESLRHSDRKNRRKSADPAEELSQIELRLAQLRGEEPSLTKNMDPTLVSKKAETEDGLLKRLGNEAKLDKQYNDNLVTDLEERLGRLRQPLNTKNISPEQSSSGASATDKHTMDIDQKSGGDEDDEETEKQQIQNIIDRFVAEVALESKTGDNFSEHEVASGMKLTTGDGEAEEILVDSSDDDLNDDQMCRICDGRAKLLCKECDGDIFCSKCFQEFHSELGEIHKSTPYKK